MKGILVVLTVFFLLIGCTVNKELPKKQSNNNTKLKGESWYNSKKEWECLYFHNSNYNHQKHTLSQWKKILKDEKEKYNFMIGIAEEAIVDANTSNQRSISERWKPAGIKNRSDILIEYIAATKDTADKE